MRLAASQLLYAYWNQLRGARGAPERNDIEPGAISGILADTFILEFERRVFPMRIAGSRTNALYLRELRGESFLEIWRPEDRSEIEGILLSVADEAQPFLVGAAGGPQGIEPVDVEVLLLPLRHRGATHARVLGSCAPRFPPKWLGLLPIGALSLTSSRALGDEEQGDRTFLRRDPRRQNGFQRRRHLFVYSADD